MNKIYKYLGVVAIMLFSFFYTDKITFFIKSKSPLMQEIKKESSSLNVQSVNAIIDESTIIPGLNGLEVDLDESYNNMKDTNEYNKNKIIYKQSNPQLSLKENTDKIIKRGNPLKKSISIILEDKIYTNYFVNKNIKVDVLANLDNYEITKQYEIINAEEDNYNGLKSLLKKSSIDNSLCFVSNQNKKSCLKNKEYLINNNKELNGSNIISLKKSIESGDIILITKTADYTDIDILLSEIQRLNLKIVYVSELISEQNN